MLFFDLINSYFKARELGRDPNFYEIFRKMHVKKADGQFVDNKSQMIAISISYINKLFNYCSKC